MAKPMAHLWFLLFLYLTVVSRSTSLLCDTVISPGYNGTIESPGFPQEYYGDQNCSYTFSSGSSYSTWQINFTFFNLPNTSCDSDYIEVYNNSQYQRYCYNSTPPPDLRDIYRFRFVSSINASAGFGFQARVSKVPKCGSTDIRLHENSPFQMYYSQNEPVHGRCEWTLTAEQGLAIVMIGYISYNDINVNQQFKMYRGRTKDNSSLITIKSRYNEIAIDEASNIILIEYIANETSYFYVYVTFMAYNRTQNSTCGSATYNSSVEGVINLYTDGLSNINGYYRNGICTWTIEAQEGEVIQLEVTYFYIQSATPGCNDSARSYLEVYDGSQTEDRLLVRACSFDPLVPVTSKTRRLVVVLTLDEEFGFTRASFTARYKSFNNSAILRDCGGDIYGDEGVVSSPNYPANYDNLRDCEWRITVEDSFNIRVDIHDLDIRPYNYGYYCAGDSLLFTGAYPFGYSTGLYYRVCGTYYGYYRGPPIYSTNNSLTMRFVSDWENTGRGFNASWRKACDMILQTSNGWIKSPRFPTGYPNNLNCSYILQTPNNQPGYFITFTFNSFDLQEPDSKGSCIYDYLELVQVPSYNPGYFITPNAKVFCGRGPTQSLTTYFPTTIHFVTDGSITKGGFNISFIQTMAGCGESLYMGEKGFVTSPNYPGTFPRLINCTTTIRVEPGHNITLTFQSFFLGNYLANVNGSNCWWRAGGVLEVYDRISSQSVLTGTYCGYSSPQPITSTSNELTLVFRCTYNDYATGFNATYISTLALTAFRDCGGQLNGTNGEIISPRYPDLYPANAVCEWIITGDTGDRVRLSFVDFHLQDTISCQLDSLEMRDGSSVYSPRLDRVCGDAIPQEVTSTGNIMLVRFVTDGEMTYRGFKASWTSVCEETYRTTEGIIQSPSYPNSYPRRKQCTYFIEQREGYVFELTFTNFSLGDVRGSCSKNYVEVRDGGFDTSPLLGSRYCGGDLPPVLTSSQSLMWIRFVTDGSSTNKGFRATFKIGTPSCGSKTLTEKQGVFTSPNFPNIYPNNVECTWLIQGVPNEVVTLTFTSFQLEGWTWCPWDWVNIYDGDKLLNTFCGSTIPSAITTETNVMTVVFHTDWSVIYQGFSAYYKIYNMNSDEQKRQYDLYPYGEANGDRQLLKEKDSVAPVYIKTGFPFKETLQYKAFVSQNGLISFEKQDKGKKQMLKKDRIQILPFHTDISLSNKDSAVFYRLTTNNNTILNKASAEVREFTQYKDYTASLVLVATWHRVSHEQSRNPNAEQATFQVALVSNGRQTFGIIFYKNGAMKWKKRSNEKLIIGVTNGNEDEAILSEYSNTKIGFQDLDKTIGNTGRYGMQIYELGDRYSADQVCQDWYDRNLPLDVERQKNFQRLPQCPCHWNFLWGNWIWSHYIHDYTVICYRMILGRSRSVSPHGQECCYRWRWNWWNWWDWSSNGQFIADAPDAGSATAFNPVFWSLRADYQREDREAHDICCYNTTSPEYCQMYYELRPVRTCTTRMPFSFSFTWGDPHIKTLDGGEYTFNGWGEYIMFSVMTTGTNCTLQGRTGLAETENGTLTNATVFTAFGAEENGVRVFVELQNGTDGMIIFGDNTEYTIEFLQQENNFLVEAEAFTLKNDNNSLTVTFSSGIGLTISVGFKSLDIAVTMPEEFRGLIKGLLGNFNGNPSDDFLLPNGRTLSSNLTDRQIYETFGPFWAVTEENTVMRYPPRRGPANYSHPDFVPIFLDEQPQDVLQAARAKCGDSVACIYDYVATGSAAMADASKDTAGKADDREKLSKNTAPILTFNATLTVVIGQPVNFNLGGYDPDKGDVLTYHAVNKSDLVVQVDPRTGDVTLNVTSAKTVTVSFYAEDSLKVQSPVRDVSIIACNSTCRTHGTCDFLTPIPTDVATFFWASCTCAPGWTGKDCDEDLDACQKSPCGAEQECVDLTPAQQGSSEIGFRCGACPVGFMTDPLDATRCIDVNECVNSTLTTCGRNATCENTPGSYICVCASGFRLQTNFNCEDINECAEHTDNCQQVCVNSEGNFDCQCYPGYTLSDKGTCEPDSQTSGTCAVLGCDHGCIVTPDLNGTLVPSCFCNSGFRLSGNRTCVDRDECSEGVCSQACVNTVGSFFCKCYTGYLLGSDERTCSPCPSMQYGTDCSLTCQCSGRALTCDPVTGCVCREGWRGIRCDEDIDECTENPDRCGAGYVCSNTNGSFICDCPSGYSKNAAGKCEDVDECAPRSVLNTCGELEDCINVPGTFYCRCRTGYRRQNDHCTDVNECANGASDCEQLCVNVEGSYNCECRYGYTANPDRTTCYMSENVCRDFELLDCQQGCSLDDSDRGVCFCLVGYQLNHDNITCSEINPCLNGRSGCSHGCENTGVHYTCSCPPGMMLDNDLRTCIACPPGTYGDNCARDCTCGTGSSGCNATTGCVCKPGWTGTNCDQDVNECDTVSAQEECRQRQANCLNLQGGYRCQCPPGYTTDQSNICRDIDECTSSPSPCGQICENSLGSYRCLCNTGFFFNASSKQCEDVDECALTATNNCTQRCDNTLGSYRCGCNIPGSVLSNDGVTCQASVNCTRTDCPRDNGGCSLEECFCNSGYNMSINNDTCSFIPVNWCGVASPCQQTCSNAADGKTFYCSCSAGYLLNKDGRTCRECPDNTYGTNCANECTCNRQNTQSCNKTTGACTCKGGWTGSTCDTDVNECTAGSVTCPVNSICVNLPGTYLCSCYSGFFKSNQTCLECAEGFYGASCASACSCSVNTVSCNKTTGSCTCKAGWTGTRCDTDVNECALGVINCTGSHVVCVNVDGGYRCDCSSGYTYNTSSSTCSDTDECSNDMDDCLQVCTNTNGSYTCSCASDYWGTGNDCTEMTKVPATLVVDIPIPASELANPYSVKYEGWKQMTAGAVFKRLTSRVPGLKEVHILRLSAGSLIVDCQFVLDDHTYLTAVSDLISSLADLAFTSITIGNYSGNVVITVKGTSVSSASLCTVYDLVSQCPSGEQCQVEDSKPVCRTNPKDDVALIVGLTVGLTLAILLIVAVVIIYIKKKKTRKGTRKNSSVVPVSSKGEVYPSVVMPAWEMTSNEKQLID
ncbi:uncharacterized protein LOC112557056 isoform X3 [Pomacea canaliculata]|uniref:uncharacterized protein LOC112557056 isoform X3 n=1 Tax=Pomacea canaliculata TaxID=400727 RepID=UPI000D72FD3F|nr:uncharacterized protein LOC112557056 isoform X3 [Pomacea canaliculata]